ncbi:MAG: hypothetical protein SGBAC_009935 [Bacillariaceae sp.]
MHLEDEITKRLFMTGIVAVAIVPRQHIDESRCSIGGGTISHSFRKLLLASLVINWMRLFSKIAKFNTLTITLGMIQILSLTFLCFVTPYILQTWMATRIFIGKRPGENLMVPLYLAAILATSGMVLAKTVNPIYWGINRLGNVVTGPPVLKTLKMYNSLTNVGSHHAGRGNILCQTLYVFEVWCMITEFLCAVGYGFGDHSKSKSDYTAWDSMLLGFRGISFFSFFTRVLVHSIFVNLLDELSLTSGSSAASGAEGGVDPRGADEGSFENEEADNTIIPVWYLFVSLILRNF